MVALAMAAAPLTFALVASAQMGPSSATGTAPSRASTAKAGGPLVVSALPSAGVRTVVGGTGEWTSLAAYQVENTTDMPIAIGRMDFVLASSGDPADFQEVAVRRGADVLPTTYVNGAWSFVSNVATNDFYVPGSKAALFVAPKSKVALDLVVKLSAPVSGAAVGDAWVGVPRSGHAPSLRLNAFEGIDATMRAIPGSVPKDPSPAVVLRKAYPVFARMPLVTNVLGNGDRQLYRFSVAAAHGPISWKQLQFNVGRTGGFSLSNFRLMRGAAEVPSGAATVRVRCGGAWSGAAPAGALCDRLSIQWNGEDVLSLGETVSYTLAANVSGASGAATLELSPAHTMPGNTARIVTGRPMGGEAAEYRLKPVFPVARGIAAFDAAFLWSDLSAVPHAASVDPKYASADWSDGSYLDDAPPAADLQTLSRP